MGGKVEGFLGALHFTPWVALLDLVLIIHFFVSWRRSAVKSGWKLDFWTLNLFLIPFLPLCLFYPFNGSIFNAPLTGPFYSQIVGEIDRAFLISASGYVCIWVGRSLCDLFPRNILLFIFSPFARLIEQNVKSRIATALLFLFTFLLGMLIIGFEIQNGVLFQGRSYFLQQDALRPLFNFTIALFPLACAFLALRYLQFQERTSLLLFALLLAMTLLFGVRGVFFGSVLFFFACKVYCAKGKVHLRRTFCIAAFLFFTALYLNDLRDGITDPRHSLGLFVLHFFYGNNFSDTRDFAWILSEWDGVFLQGKSYAAGLLSFIPRSLTTFRQDWSLALYTNSMLGFDSATMPGLRPGLFGEAFLNFGYLGVGLFGLLYGYVLRTVDLWIKRAPDAITGYSYTIAYTLVLNLSVSASLWGFYVCVGAHILISIIRYAGLRVLRS
ncbi:MAG: O-antigen polysaccharide polymerase Wzy [Verrucomicrobia bacterium]|nr:O-antigen polysaccharide polymerase Wzy [Verrucomicrobiota bacterium]